MSIDITMPALSPTMEKGNIAKWLVQPGDHVKAGDMIAEIETDKATMEVEASGEGYLAEILVPAGSEDVAVGMLIARMSADAPAAGGAALVSRPEQAKVAPAQEEPVPVPAPVTPAHAAPAPAPVAPAPVAQAPVQRTADADVKASPLAARIAGVRGIDLSAIEGSGARGRIMKQDLGLEPIVAPSPLAGAAIAAAPVAIAPPPAGVPLETVKLSAMRRTIARRLTESKQQVPHIYLTVDIVLDRLLALRTQLNASLESRGVKLSVNDLIIKAQAVALMATPEVNVQFAGDVLHRFARADISVAVSMPGGLITPIIASADTKSVAAISSEMKDLAQRARAGTLAPAEYHGGTASLSNLGMFGIRQFKAIINPPQAMILAVGEGSERIVPVDGEARVATVMTATGSFDHRAIDGADAAAFMRAFRQLIEDPMQIVA